MTGLEESWWMFGMFDKYALWICGVLHVQGSRHSPLDPIMGHHPVHLVANGRDAWDGARQTFWQVPWTGPGSVCEEVGTVDRGTTTASCGGKRGHRVHGGRRPSVEKHLHVELPWMQFEKCGERWCCWETIRVGFPLDSSLWLGALATRPSPELELDCCNLFGCSHHVSQVWN